MRLLIKALPFFLIVFFMFKSGDWAKQTIKKTKDTVLTHVTDWEMSTVNTQLGLDLNTKAKYVKGNYENFLKNIFPNDLEDLKTDAWGTEYQYIYDGLKKNYTFTSAGPDKIFGTIDDIIKQSAIR